MIRLSLLAAGAAVCLASCASAPRLIEGQALVTAALETSPAGARGDAADDPVLWLDPADAAKSLILGTNKQEGLVVFRLDGSEAQRLPIGLINNVDLRQFADNSYDVAFASNDQFNAISVFFIDRATGTVTHGGDVPTGKIEPYGICSGREDDRDYAGVMHSSSTQRRAGMAAGAAL